MLLLFGSLHRPYTGTPSLILLLLWLLLIIWKAFTTIGDWCYSGCAFVFSSLRSVMFVCLSDLQVVWHLFVFRNCFVRLVKSIVVIVCLFKSSVVFVCLSDLQIVAKEKTLVRIVCPGCRSELKIKIWYVKVILGQSSQHKWWTNPASVQLRLPW